MKLNRRVDVENMMTLMQELNDNAMPEPQTIEAPASRPAE
jgi:hypothetical protein